MSKIRVVIYLFITTVLVGTIGFKVVGGESWSILDSLYMTVITLSTVGFQEVHNLEPGGKIWTIIVISLGIGIVAFAVSQATE
ncbi:MAG: two pore domain potassium channel family protein [Candidatus Marinimicrobia bacterium]|nr:two pore domain potassium channel family protein [Candidatus Neomarinimicrobiota bacterium]